MAQKGPNFLIAGAGRLGTLPPRDIATEKKLLELYREDIQQLEQILKRDLSPWLA